MPSVAFFPEHQLRTRKTLNCPAGISILSPDPLAKELPGFLFKAAEGLFLHEQISLARKSISNKPRCRRRAIDLLPPRSCTVGIGSNSSYRRHVLPVAPMIQTNCSGASVLLKNSVLQDALISYIRWVRSILEEDRAVALLGWSYKPSHFNHVFTSK